MTALTIRMPFHNRFALGLSAVAAVGCGSTAAPDPAGNAGGGQVSTAGGSAGGTGGLQQAGNATGGTFGVGGSLGGTGGGRDGGGAGGAAGSGGVGLPDPTLPMQHRFLSSVARPGPLAIVNAAGAIEWQVAIEVEANDAWLLPNGNIAYAYLSGAREITPDKQEVWNYSAPAGSEMHSCQPLGGGRFLLGEAHAGGVGYLREVDSNGAVQSTVTIQGDAALGGHDQFREVRKTPTNTYIVNYISTRKAMEFDAQGKLLREFPCGSFAGFRLPNGNTLLSCGDDHRVVEVDAENKVVWEVNEQDIAGNVLGFAAGIQRLANGNTVIANWPGHGGDASQPQIFEITKDKQVVWEVTNPDLKLVTNFMILDADALVDGGALR